MDAANDRVADAKKDLIRELGSGAGSRFNGPKNGYASNAMLGILLDRLRY